MAFIDPPAPDAAAQRLYDDDVAEIGYVMNASRLWAHQPASSAALFALMNAAVAPLDLDRRRRGILVAACAATLGDSYCSLAWGSRLAAAADDDTAASVIRGHDEGLTDAERAMAGWARAVALDPNGTVRADVGLLRDHGFSDAEVFAITLFVALRMAFSAVNDALGARPDAELRTSAPAAVLDAVTFGRRIAEAAP